MRRRRAFRVTSRPSPAEEVGFAVPVDWGNGGGGSPINSNARSRTLLVDAPLGIFCYFGVTDGHTLGFATGSASATLVVVYAVLFRLISVPFPPRTGTAVAH